MAGGCVWAATLLFKVGLPFPNIVLDSVADADDDDDDDAEMKLVVATIYTNYTTEIVDDEGIEQADTIISGPVGGKLILRFKRV